MMLRRRDAFGRRGREPLCPLNVQYWNIVAKSAVIDIVNKTSIACSG